MLDSIARPAMAILGFFDLEESHDTFISEIENIKMKYLRYCDIRKCFIKYRILKMIKTNKIFEGLNKCLIKDYFFL